MIMKFKIGWQLLKEDCSETKHGYFNFKGFVVMFFVPPLYEMIQLLSGHNFLQNTCAAKQAQLRMCPFEYFCR